MRTRPHPTDPDRRIGRRTLRRAELERHGTIYALSAAVEVAGETAPKGFELAGVRLWRDDPSRGTLRWHLKAEYRKEKA